MVERNHSHILDIARALKFQASIPCRFWGECVQTAVYILNRLPSRILNGKSPFELLYGRASSLAHLSVFGYLFYATNVLKKDKFAARERHAALMVYSITPKGYGLYDLSTNIFFVSRDVVFREYEFPFPKSHEIHVPSLLDYSTDVLSPQHEPTH